jgi:hypothetical protein
MASVTDLGARDEQGRAMGRPFIDTIYHVQRRQRDDHGHA